MIYLLFYFIIFNFFCYQREQWCFLNKDKMIVFEVVYLLDGLVDESDLDTDLLNLVYVFQIVERIRVDYFDKEWFYLIGFFYDLGKVMVMWGEFQYFVVGDT